MKYLLRNTFETFGDDTATTFSTRADAEAGRLEMANQLASLFFDKRQSFAGVECAKIDAPSDIGGNMTDIEWSRNLYNYADSWCGMNGVLIPSDSADPTIEEDYAWLPVYDVVEAILEALEIEESLSVSDKAALAADAINATRVDAGWVYFDDSTREYYLCEDQEEMADLYDLQHSNDSDIASDAYSHWCAGTSHSGCDENGVVGDHYTSEDIALEKRLASVANEEGTIQAYDMLKIAPHSAPQLHTTMNIKAAFTALTGKAYDTDFFCG